MPLGSLLGPLEALLGGLKSEKMPTDQRENHFFHFLDHFWTPFWGPKFALFLVISGVIFWTTFWSLFRQLFEPILGPILGPDRPKRGQDEPKRAIKSSKEPKSCIFKNLKKPYVFEGFWVQRPPKRASRGPRRLPRGTQRASEPNKKGIQK